MTVLDFSVVDIDGKTRSLREFEGKVLLLVNVASQCGLTPQYAGLQELWTSYQSRGLVVLGFPCNQFGGQEPGSEAQVKQFCETRFGVTFPMFAKVDVNGPARHPLYEHLTTQPTQPEGPGNISWNFAKFLVDRTGTVVARFAPTTAPASDEIVRAIEAALG